MKSTRYTPPHTHHHTRKQYKKKLLFLLVCSSALFSVEAIAGQEIIVDQDHPFTGSGTGNYSFFEGENRSDNVITITTYNGLSVKNRLYGVRPGSGDASNNTLTINAQGEWFQGTAIQGVYLGKDPLGPNDVKIGSANSNHVILNGGTYSFDYDNGVTAANISGGISATENTVEINEQTEITGGSVRGAEVNNLSDLVANNGVIINGGTIGKEPGSLTANAAVYGVFYQRGKASIEGNFVEINGGTFDFKEIAAAKISAGTPTEIKDNVVTINEGTFNSGSIYGVSGVGSNAASGNGVIINGGTFTGSVKIYANTSNKTGQTNDFIKINANDQMNLNGANLYGSIYTYANSLIINGANNLKIGNINYFKELNLSNIVWQTDSPAISIRANAHFETISISQENGFQVDVNQRIAAGDSMTLVRAESGYGFSSRLDLSGETSDTLYTQANVARKISGNIVLSNDGNDLDFVVKDVELSEQTILLAENRAVAAAFINEGDAALKALDTPDTLVGYSTFATAEGAASEYSANDDLKINGWHFAAGVQGLTHLNSGASLTSALYFEAGRGNYRTENSFNEETFEGSGDLYYRGGGLAVRYRLASDFYVEGSVRAGELKTEMDRAVRASSGELLGYSLRSFYWGAHAGLGQILENDASTLDLYGRIYHTEVDGEDFNLGGDRFIFDDVKSTRTRIGAKIRSKAWGIYAGAAAEYEFNGDAKMSAADLDAPTESLKGLSMMGEVGWSWASDTSPWAIDVRVGGWGGARRGMTSQAYCAYRF